MSTNKPEDNLPLFNCKNLFADTEFKQGEVRHIVAATGEGKSEIVPNPKIIKLEDNIESWANAVKELHEAAKKGGGIGIDLRSIKDDNRKQQMIEGINNIVDRAYLSYRKSTPTIFDTEEAVKAITINRQLGTQTRGLAEIVKTIKKGGKK